jgi:hypothetical protein
VDYVLRPNLQFSIQNLKCLRLINAQAEGFSHHKAARRNLGVRLVAYVEGELALCPVVGSANLLDAEKLTSSQLAKSPLSLTYVLRPTKTPVTKPTKPMRALKTSLFQLPRKAIFIASKPDRHTAMTMANLTA